MLSRFFGKKAKKQPVVIAEVSTSVKDYSQSDYFVKKAEEAKQTLAKYGYPKQLTAAK